LEGFKFDTMAVFEFALSTVLVKLEVLPVKAGGALVLPVTVAVKITVPAAISK
jgi:hypothetical protein